MQSQFCTIEAFYQVSSTPGDLLANHDAIAASSYNYEGYFSLFDQKASNNTILVIGVNLATHAINQVVAVKSDYYPTNIQWDDSFQYILALASNGYQFIKISTTEVKMVRTVAKSSVTRGYLNVITNVSS